MSGEVLPRNPTTGIADCCARTVSGHAAAPPSSVMNSRRLMPIMGFDLSRALPGGRHDSSNRAGLARGLPHLEPASGRGQSAAGAGDVVALIVPDTFWQPVGRPLVRWMV